MQRSSGHAAALGDLGMQRRIASEHAVVIVGRGVHREVDAWRRIEIQRRRAERSQRMGDELTHIPFAQAVALQFFVGKRRGQLDVGLAEMIERRS